MGNLPILIIYTAMLIFDFAIFAGTAYLITQHNWSVWWMLVAAIICVGSSPINILKAWTP